jgi:hypothetical protein
MGAGRWIKHLAITKGILRTMPNPAFTTHRV